MCISIWLFRALCNKLFLIHVITFTMVSRKWDGHVHLEGNDIVGTLKESLSDDFLFGKIKDFMYSNGTFVMR